MAEKKKQSKAKRPSQEQAEENRVERLVRASTAIQVDVADTDIGRYTVPVWNLPMPVLRKIREETGRKWERHLGQIGDLGVDAYALFWWVSRLAGGEDITHKACDAEWEQRCAGVTLGDIDANWVTLGADDEDADPEA